MEEYDLVHVHFASDSFWMVALNGTMKTLANFALLRHVDIIYTPVFDPQHRPLINKMRMGSKQDS